MTPSRSAQVSGDDRRNPLSEVPQYRSRRRPTGPALFPPPWRHRDRDFANPPESMTPTDRVESKGIVPSLGLTLRRRPSL